MRRDGEGKPDAASSQPDLLHNYIFDVSLQGLQPHSELQPDWHSVFSPRFFPSNGAVDDHAAAAFPISQYVNSHNDLELYGWDADHFSQSIGDICESTDADGANTPVVKTEA